MIYLPSMYRYSNPIDSQMFFFVRVKKHFLEKCQTSKKNRRTIRNLHRNIYRVYVSEHRVK